MSQTVNFGGGGWEGRRSRQQQKSLFYQEYIHKSQKMSLWRLPGNCRTSSYSRELNSRSDSWTVKNRRHISKPALPQDTFSPGPQQKQDMFSPPPLEKIEPARFWQLSSCLVRSPSSSSGWSRLPSPWSQLPSRWSPPWRHPSGTEWRTPMATDSRSSWAPSQR